MFLSCSIKVSCSYQTLADVVCAADEETTMCMLRYNMQVSLGMSFMTAAKPRSMHATNMHPLVLLCMQKACRSPQLQMRA